jgi:hypothetical protein
VERVSFEGVADHGKHRELNYQLTRSHGTRLRFRGPLPDFDAPFIAMLGGTETFGKFVRQPFPSLVAEWTGLPVANLGIAQAGLSIFSEEVGILDIASRARVAVLQVLGAQNMSNRLYSVHSRRNDRFLGVSPALRDIFPKVDFAEINFTGHLLETLSRQSPASFDVLVEELRWAWVQRMRRIVGMIGCQVLLLWISDRRPEETWGSLREGEPFFVDRAMLRELAPDVAGIVEVILPRTGGLEGKICPEEEEGAARSLPGPAEHARIAEALAERLAALAEAPGHAVGAARAQGS